MAVRCVVRQVSHRGQARWMVLKEASHSDKFTEYFLQSLITDAGKKDHLILDTCGGITNIGVCWFKKPSDDQCSEFDLSPSST